LKDNTQEDRIKDSTDWKQGGFDPFVSRTPEAANKQADFIPGAQFEVLLDDMLFNRMIKLKDLRVKPQGNDLGKIYWDGDNQKVKLWVGDGQWADVLWSSTSTSSTSSSTSSTSTSSTSTSTSTT
jgi:hypothetical protein